MMRGGFRGKRALAATVFLLVICDPLLAMWPASGGATRLLENEEIAGSLTNWEGAIDLDPQLGHALGLSVGRLPPVWGNSLGVPTPNGFPPTCRLGSDGEVCAEPHNESVVWSLRERLAQSVVQIVSEDSPAPCTDYDGLRLTCGERRYQFVGKYAGAIRGVDLPCTWLHPYEDGELQVRVLDLPKTERITGFMGLLDGAGKRADVHIEGRFNSRKLFKSTLNKDQKFVALKGKLPAAAPGHLELRIWTRDDHWRLLCLGLYGLERSR